MTNILLFYSKIKFRMKFMLSLLIYIPNPRNHSTTFYLFAIFQNRKSVIALLRCRCDI